MRRRILIVGIIILVIGIAFAGISVAESAREIKSVGTMMYQGQNGDYYSNLINVTSTEGITVVSTTNAYVIPSSDLNLINSSNVGSFKISSYEVTGNTSLYSNLNGSYYVVAFGATVPKLDYAVVTISAGLVAIGVLLIIGVLLVVVGIILSIIGAVLKPRKNFQQQF